MRFGVRHPRKNVGNAKRGEEKNEEKREASLELREDQFSFRSGVIYVARLNAPLVHRKKKSKKTQLKGPARVHR